MRQNDPRERKLKVLPNPLTGYHRWYIYHGSDAALGKEFYESADDGRPVQDFLDGLDKPRRAKVMALIALLGEQGPTLPFPYSSQVRGKIRELRTQYGKERYRVLYFGGPKRTFVLLHALEKSSEKLSERDIKIAEQRMKRHLRKTRTIEE